MTRPPCDQCGHIHPRCIRHRKRRDDDGNLVPCGGMPMQGQEVCRMHGGSSPQAKKAAAKRLAQAEAEASIAGVEVRPIGDPLDALAQIAAEAVALKDHFADLVAELGKQMAFVTGKIGVDGEGNLGLEQKLDARVALYERALDRSHKFLADWVRLGFEERKAQLDDARAALVRTVLIGVLTELGHQVDDPTTRTSLERWLPVLDGEPPPAITA